MRLMGGRRIVLKIRGRGGRLLPGATVRWYLNDQPAGKAENAEGIVYFSIDSNTADVSVSAEYPEEKPQGPIKLAQSQQSYEFWFDRDPPSYTWKEFFMKHFPAFIGVCFILLAVALAFSVNTTNSLQHHILLALLALGGGGFGGEIAGFLRTDLTLGDKLKVSAGGAMAIFVLLYFFVPGGTP